MNLASILSDRSGSTCRRASLPCFALMAALQIGGFVLVNTVGTTAARTTIGDELIAGEQVLLRSLQQESCV
jgi:hypothetical protein